MISKDFILLFIADDIAISKQTVFRMLYWGTWTYPLKSKIIITHSNPNIVVLESIASSSTI